MLIVFEISQKHAFAPSWLFEYFCVKTKVLIKKKIFRSNVVFRIKKIWKLFILTLKRSVNFLTVINTLFPIFYWIKSQNDIGLPVLAMGRVFWRWNRQKTLPIYDVIVCHSERNVVKWRILSIIRVYRTITILILLWKTSAKIFLPY